MRSSGTTAESSASPLVFITSKWDDADTGARIEVGPRAMPRDSHALFLQREQPLATNRPRRRRKLANP